MLSRNTISLFILECINEVILSNNIEPMLDQAIQHIIDRKVQYVRLLMKPSCLGSGHIVQIQDETLRILWYNSHENCTGKSTI